MMTFLHPHQCMHMHMTQSPPTQHPQILGRCSIRPTRTGHDTVGRSKMQPDSQQHEAVPQKYHTKGADSIGNACRGAQHHAGQPGGRLCHRVRAPAT